MFLDRAKLFWDACEQGDTKKAKKLLKKPILGLFGRPVDAELAMHVAVLKRNDKVIRSLILLGVDVDKPFLFRYSDKYQEQNGRLHFAAFSNDVDMVQFLLKYTSNVNKVNEFGNTPLHIATMSNSFEVAEVLLAAGSDINQVDNNGFTPLWHATFNGNIKLVKYLLSAGAKVDKPTNKGTTPLLMAVSDKNTALAKVLLEAGADIECTDEYGITPLLTAVSDKNTALAKVLLEAGADIDRANEYGMTPLLSAVSDKNTALAKVLLEAGADIDRANEYGMTPLLSAVSGKNTVLAKVLLEAGADIDRANEYDITPLTLAIDNNDVEMARTLLEHGADVNNKTMIVDCTPLFRAVAKSNIHRECVVCKDGEWVKDDIANEAKHGEEFCKSLRMIKLLLEYGADKNMTDIHGRTVMDWACPEVQRLLTAISVKRNGIKKALSEQNDAGVKIIFHGAQKVSEMADVWRFVHTRG
ncbi:MAG: ankyrin repeat domain-containing protein [Alphaproteobacteria bacterium]|nr:ankyrin repeat domain-containing protein [Alphaproteobacteria bacterium]